MENFKQNLKISLHKGFINQKYAKAGRYTPKLLVNNTEKNESVLFSLLEEIEYCDSFIFSVAFITESGLATLKSYLFDLKRKGIKGRILTSTFLNFNQPKVFKELLKITNVEVRLTDVEGFHSKGYIFHHSGYYSLIVGSSNLTSHALKTNHEWNVKLTSHEDGDIIYHFKNQFEEVWNKSRLLTKTWIYNYEKTYSPTSFNQAERVVELPADYNENSIEETLKIDPNKMQKAALKEIQTVRDSGYKKGLIISATGTGKTYLAAFDVRRFAPKKMLFIVHREQILMKAKDDFQQVMGGPKDDFGILSGFKKETNAKYLFATIQTISKQDMLNHFDPEEFDYILIDEVHKAGAKSYLRVFDYFKPMFLMGMTATPERTDDFNIYELFDYHIAYEIRLQEALSEDMLCPFHYFGVTDFEYNGELIDDTTILTKLVTKERVNHIIDKIWYYGYSGNRVKGLMFCSRKEEAIQLSDALNDKGFNTFALTGDHSPEQRLHHIDRLENGALDYILTVDIFNEGIDIPSINQVVMLRQTQSSIVFIQQLGRGLRKHNSKDFVTIIDFIGNYKNNYLIPVALSGDKSQNKDNIRRHTSETNYLKGVSTVNFEEIAKKQIYQSINTSNLTAMRILKEAYTELKNRIGRIPYQHDFILNYSIDPIVITEKFKNYYQFLLKMKEDIPSMNKYENQVLTMLSSEILNGKRKHELILLELLLKSEKVSYSIYIEKLIEVHCRTDDKTLNSVRSVYDLSFFTQTEQKKYGNQPIIYLSEENVYYFNENIQESLKSNFHFKYLLIDILKSALEKNKKYDEDKPLTLYKKYTRKDTCKLLNWHKDESSTMFGYKPKYDTCPIFITYHKDDDVEMSVDYEDEFLNPEIIKWYTRSNRTIKSNEVQKILNADIENRSIHIFVKKDDDEGSGFYYLGEASPDTTAVHQDKMQDKNGKEIPVVNMNMELEQPVDHTLYNYIIDNLEV